MARGQEESCLRKEVQMRFKVRACAILSGVAFVLLLALQVKAQEFNYKVQLDRPIGHRDGELIINQSGIEYRATKRENEDRSWSYNRDIKLLEILSPTKIRIWTYKDLELVPGKNESLTFKIVEGQFDQSVSDFLREHLSRPFVTSFIEGSGTAIAEISVKHSHRFGGCEGTLRVYPDRLIYDSQTGHDSRTWLWTDIRSVGRPDVYHLDLETFEPQIGTSSRSFNFILKEQMADKNYDLIWSRVYRPTPLIRAASSIGDR